MPELYENINIANQNLTKQSQMNLTTEIFITKKLKDAIWKTALHGIENEDLLTR